jgi:hypothetical protein
MTPYCSGRSSGVPAAEVQPVERFGWQIWLALLIAAAVIIPRSIAISVAHSESYDDRFHLMRGLEFLTGNLSRKIADRTFAVAHPPLGEGIVALPLLLMNRYWGRPASELDLYGHPVGRDTLVAVIAAWTSVLFLPMVAAAFLWAGRVYGRRSAWLVTALLIIEPTLAAHIPIPAQDVLSAETIFLACYLAWRLVDRPTLWRAAALGAMTAVAMNVKHTAIILPAVVAAMAGVGWVIRPWTSEQVWAEWRGQLPMRLKATAAAALTAIALLWPATFFDVSAPLPIKVGGAEATGQNEVRSSAKEGGAEVTRQNRMRKLVKDLLGRPWPAGIFFHSVLHARGHNKSGHPGYLMGETSMRGWWYYFPTVATFKVPLGIGLILLLAAASIRAVPPRWDEAYLLLPWAAWSLLLATSKINIGFRHYLAPYLFLLVLASRCVANGNRLREALAWLCLAAAGLHTVSFHPDYLSYINFYRTRYYMMISDSNIDWGQSLKEVRHWLDSHPRADRPVYLAYFGDDLGGIEANLGDLVEVLDLPAGEVPDRPGILIISPVVVTGQYPSRGGQYYRALRPVGPDAVIGHAMLVYDLARPEAAPLLRAQTQH